MWILLAIALRQDRILEASRHAHALLADHQQPPPDDLQRRLRRGVEAADAADWSGASMLLEAAVADAARTQYL